MKINPYLNFPGTAEEAFTFYKSIFGGEFIQALRFKDAGDHRMPEADQGKMMHIAMPLGDGNILMATDSLESMGEKFVAGNNFYISINADTKEEADRVYNALSAGGKINMPIGDSPWGSYFGMLKDKFGIQWMMSYEYPK